MEFNSQYSSSQVPKNYVNPQALDKSKQTHSFEDELNQLMEDITIEEQVNPINKTTELILNESLKTIKTAKGVKHLNIFEEYSKQLMHGFEKLISILKETKCKKTTQSIVKLLDELDQTIFKKQYDYLKSELNAL